MLDSDHDKSFKNSAIKNSYEQKLRYLSASRKELNIYLCLIFYIWINQKNLEKRAVHSNKQKHRHKMIFWTWEKYLLLVLYS